MKAVLAKLGFASLPVLVAVAIAAPASAHPAEAAFLENSGQKTQQLSTNVVPASSPADCPPKNLCFWVSAGWKGKMGKVSGDNGSWTKFSEPNCPGGTWNDCASALDNNGQKDSARVFRENNGGGGGRCLPIGTKWSNLTDQFFDNGISMNDAISSNDWIPTACR